MARVPNDVFHFLVSRNIFKNWFRTDKASEKTEQRRKERTRGVLVWLSTGHRTNLDTGLKMKVGKGTFRGNVKETFKGIHQES